MGTLNGGLAGNGGGSSGGGGGAVASVFGRTGAVVAASGDYEGVVAAALTGATAATRYVGGTSSGAPASGTFAVGDYIVDQTGKIWVCTVAGSPGTWTQVGASAGVSSFNSRSGAVVPTSGDYTASQVTGALVNSNNLSDVSSVSTARGNLAAAPVASPTFTGTTTAPEFSASGLTGATAASRYVGATASGAPASGTFAVGDYVVDQTGKIWVCTTAGTPGTWTQVGAGSGVSSFNTRTGAVSLSKSDVTGTGLIWSDVTAAEQLQAVAVKSSAYAAASGNFVPCDLSGGIFTVTLPLTPAEGTRIGVKIVKQAAVPNTLTIATGGGSDVFNIAGGNATLTIAANKAGCLLQYTAATGIWYVTAMETPLNAASGAAQLGTDGTVFGPGGSAIVSSVALPGAPTAATAPALTNNAQIATTAYADTADVTSQYQAVISTYLFR